jgi:hypothetical protein
VGARSTTVSHVLAPKPARELFIGHGTTSHSTSQACVVPADTQHGHSYVSGPVAQVFCLEFFGFLFRFFGWRIHPGRLMTKCHEMLSTTQ